MATPQVSMNDNRDNNLDRVVLVQLRNDHPARVLQARAVATTEQDTTVQLPHGEFETGDQFLVLFNDNNDSNTAEITYGSLTNQEYDSDGWASSTIKHSQLPLEIEYARWFCKLRNAGPAALKAAG